MLSALSLGASCPAAPTLSGRPGRKPRIPYPSEFRLARTNRTSSLPPPMKSSFVCGFIFLSLIMSLGEPQEPNEENQDSSPIAEPIEGRAATLAPEQQFTPPPIIERSQAEGFIIGGMAVDLFLPVEAADKVSAPGWQATRIQGLQLFNLFAPLTAERDESAAPGRSYDRVFVGPKSSTMKGIPLFFIKF